MKWWLTACLVGLAALSGGGCGGGLTMRAGVLRPAAIPVRAFPMIVVTAANDQPESVALATDVVEHLAASGRSTVRFLSGRDLAERRARNQLRPATVVVAIGIRMEVRSRAEWTRRDNLSCGPMGCVQERRPVVESIPTIVARATIVVTEGASGRELQRERVAEDESGPDELAMRLRVLHRISDRVRGMMDQRTEQVAVELHGIDHPGVVRALDDIRGGSWGRGRRRLEALTESGAFDALPPDQRAIVWYDLGHARRFDEELSVEERFTGALDAFRTAVRLRPEPRYAAALEQVEADRQSRAMVRQQQAATEHNFALTDAASAGESGEVPEPPESYRD